MQVKTRTKLKDQGYNLGAGDVVTVPAEVGKAWCDAGWADDVSGKYASAELVPGVAQLTTAKKAGAKRKPNHG